MTDDELQAEIADVIVDRWRIAMTNESTVLGTARDFANAAMPSARRYAEEFAAAKLREAAMWMELNGYDEAAVDNVIRRAHRLTDYRPGGMTPTIGSDFWRCPMCGASESVPLGHSKTDALGWHVAAEHPSVPKHDLTPCGECHPELHRSQCWPNARCVAADDEGGY